MPYEVRFDRLVRVFGIRLKPEGIRRLFGVPAARLVGRYEDMEAVAGAALLDECARIREADDGVSRRILAQRFLRGRLESAAEEPPYLKRAAALIRSPGRFDRIETLPDDIHIGLRQLERGFRASIGLTPKKYMRLARLNEVHRRLEAGEALRLTDVAYDSGYADQAHFIRDFKRLMGATPSVFRRDRDAYIVNTGRVDAPDAAGTAAATPTAAR
jgi:AraC-like DNA-binding protein